jgi:hypothetical protein
MADLIKDGRAKPRGKIIVRADTVKHSTFEVQMKVAAMNLPNRTVCFCISDNNPLLEIYRVSDKDPNTKFKAYKSLTALQTRNPIFHPFKIKGG